MALDILTLNLNITYPYQVAMEDTKIEIEAKTKKLYAIRNKIKEDQEKANALKKEIVAWMNKNNKRIVKVGEYSVEIKHIEKLFADFKLIQKYIDSKLLPEDTLRKQVFESLYIVAQQDIQLVGNKFIIKGKNDK
jgi:hypothetical protein